MLDDDLMKKITQQQEQGGIDITKLPQGTKIAVKTKNNVYKIKILEANRVLVQGGRFFPEKTECYFNGSTFGGSMLKLHWIGYDMYMEFVHEQELITTSRVQAAKIIGENWFYDMEWTTQTDLE